MKHKNLINNAKFFGKIFLGSMIVLEGVSAFVLQNADWKDLHWGAGLAGSAFISAMVAALATSIKKDLVK